MEKEIKMQIDDKLNVRYFGSQIADSQKALVDHVVKMGDALRKANNIEEDYTYNLEELEDGKAFLYGRLYQNYDSEGRKEKFSDENMQINLPPKFNKRVLDFVWEIKDKFLFKGQVVAAKGSIIESRFHANTVFTDCRVEVPRKIAEGFNTTIVIVSPTSYLRKAIRSNKVEETNEADELSKVTHQINEFVRSLEPSLAIFLGPFDSPSLLYSQECTSTAEELNAFVLNTLSEGLKNCVFVTSPSDALSSGLLPCAPMEMPKGSPIGMNSKITSDPAFIEFGPLDLFVTAFDSFFSVCKQCSFTTSKVAENHLKQIIHQCSAVPMTDPSVQIEHIEELSPKRTPHVYVAPTISTNLCYEDKGTSSIRLKTISTITFSNENGESKPIVEFYGIKRENDQLRFEKEIPRR